MKVVEYIFKAISSVWKLITSSFLILTTAIIAFVILAIIMPDNALVVLEIIREVLGIGGV